MPSDRTVLRYILGLAVTAMVTVVLVSADSYTHDLFDHFDSATFYTSGKALMNGMVPYRDFTDSKGPLLWLIYGIGYLLTPRSAVGMMWIACALYAAVLIYLFKIARLWLPSDKKAAIAAILTLMAIFFPAVRYETRAEDFCLLPLVWAMWHTLAALNGTNTKKLRHSAIAIGVAMAVTFLIKYNVTVMIGVMALIVLHRAWRSRDAVNALLMMIAGAAVVLVPAVLYMWQAGWLTDFINEYFFVNARVVASQHTLMRHPIHLLWANRWSVGLYCGLCGLSACAAVSYMTRYRWSVPLIFAGVVAMTASNAFWLYYYAMLAPFAVFGFVWLLRISPGAAKRWHVAAAALLTVVGVTAMHLWHDGSWVFRHKPERDAFYAYAAMMSRTDRPKIIYYNTCTSAYGIPVESLPGCKYWTSQSGALPYMDLDQRQAIEQRRPDFVFVQKVDDEPEWFASLGYHRYDNDTALPMLMYARDSVPSLVGDYHVSTLDALLKRNLIHP